MGIVNLNEVVGVWVGEELFCKDCCSHENLQQAKVEAFVTESAISQDEDKAYFCDDCGKRL